MKRAYGATFVTVGSGVGHQASDDRAGQIFNFFGGDGPAPRASSSSMTVTQLGGGGIVFARRDGNTFVNGIQVPNGTSLVNGRPFYEGEAVTRRSEKLLERFPAFSLVLDSIGVKKAKPAKPAVPEPWEAEPDRAKRRKCTLCRERGVATVCKPCMCATMCVKCANGTAAVRECRRCKKPIKRIERIYFE